MSNGVKAAKFHQDPDIEVIDIKDIPEGKLEHNRVDRRFWTNVVNRLLLLPNNKGLVITFNEDSYTHTNTAIYRAAKRVGIKVHVTRYYNFAYLYKAVDKKC